MLNDLTIIYYTANVVPVKFAQKVRNQLWKAKGNLPLISVSQKPLRFGENICVGQIGRSHLNIYRQALVGAKTAKTKYIALCEDDVLYSTQHFEYQPNARKFAYNMSVWALYTWEPIFSYKERRNLSGLVCERDLFIEAMEERFTLWPDDKLTPIRNWSEPGKYEGNLGVSPRESELFYTDIPNIAFSHPTALSFQNLGLRKRLGKLRCTALEYWGTVERIMEFYDRK